MSETYDSIVIGAGIAGLGVSAILAKEAGQKVLVLDRNPMPGGRLMCYAGAIQQGWLLDVGLHMIELGPKSSAHALNKRVGREVEWGPFSRSVELWNGKEFVDLARLVPLNKEDTLVFRGLLGKIAQMTDQEIEAWDNCSLAQWLDANTPQPSLRELLTDLGMIMTTIPDAIDMAAGEVLYIARDNLNKTRNVLQSSYPLDGMRGLTAGLFSAIQENGGTIRTGCEVDSVAFQNGRAVGVNVPAGPHPYESDYRLPETKTIFASRVVCALPIYQLDRVLDFNEKTTLLPHWWVKRIKDIKHEITGLVEYMIGLSEPVVPPEKLCFFSALKTKHAGFPFQGFPASNFAPSITPDGKQLLHTDIVVEHPEASDKFMRRRLLDLMWEDVKEMFPGIEAKVEFKLPYFVDGCDGLARKPGLVGKFKPDLEAPGIPNLFFAGDTYIGRGLAANGAALSAMQCADRILKKLS